MNPVDALPDDWPLYYNQTWMYDTKQGRPVFITALGTNVAGELGPFLIAKKGRYDRKPVDINPIHVECWWPRAGAYNAKSHAVFIGRRARRNMKKSTYDHYFCVWGQDVQVNTLMARGQNYLTYDSACEVLNKGLMESAAISADLILQKIKGDNKDNHFNVIYRGAEAGELIENKFIPILDGTPAAKRAELKLVQGGIPCI